MAKPLWNDPRQYLVKVSVGTRTLAGLFVCVGAVGLVPIIICAFDGNTSDRGEARAFSASAAVLALGPGLVYLFAARGMRKGQPWSARTTFWTAAGQAALAAVLVFARVASFPPPLNPGLAASPAVVTLFFVPAVLVCAVQARRAMDAVRALPSDGRAFQVLSAGAGPLPTPVQMIQPVGDSPAAPDAGRLPAEER